MEKAQCKLAIKEAKSTQNWDGMLAAAKQALEFFPEDRQFNKDLDFAKAHYLDEKLHSDVVKQLEEKGEFETLHAVYQKLLVVFPESKKLHKLLEKVDDKIQEARRKEYKAYYEKAKGTILNLLHEKKYEDAEHACYEILTQDPQNPVFLKLLNKVNSKLDRDIHKSLKSYFKVAVPKLVAEYKADKKAFIRI